MSGVHPKVAQSLARHSDINLTMNRYTHILLETQSDALKTLPNLVNASKMATSGG
jgi:integrase